MAPSIYYIKCVFPIDENPAEFYPSIKDMEECYEQYGSRTKSVFIIKETEKFMIEHTDKLKYFRDGYLNDSLEENLDNKRVIYFQAWWGTQVPRSHHHDTLSLIRKSDNSPARIKILRPSLVYWKREHMPCQAYRILLYMYNCMSEKGQKDLDCAMRRILKLALSRDLKALPHIKYYECLFEKQNKIIGVAGGSNEDTADGRLEVDSILEALDFYNFMTVKYPQHSLNEFDNILHEYGRVICSIGDKVYNVYFKHKYLYCIFVSMCVHHFQPHLDDVEPELLRIHYEKDDENVKFIFLNSIALIIDIKKRFYRQIGTPLCFTK